MNEGSFRMNKEDIRHPNLFDQSVIKGHTFVCRARKGEPLIFPVVPEVKSHCKVLGREKKRPTKLAKIQVRVITSISLVPGLIAMGVNVL
jgi:hypothetical protein